MLHERIASLFLFVNIIYFNPASMSSFAVDKQLLADEELARQLQADEDESMAKQLDQTHISVPAPAPAPAPTPTRSTSHAKADANKDVKQPPSYAPPPGYPPPNSNRPGSHSVHHHTNQVIEAGNLRAKDEQFMQNWLQQIQYECRIYNSEIEPEHETEYYCNCNIHRYKQAKYNRAMIQDKWNLAVHYPGEKLYNANNPFNNGFFSNNPYQLRTISPYWNAFSINYGPKVPNARAHATWITQTISLNNSLNKEAQNAVNAKEPKICIWVDRDGKDEEEEEEEEEQEISSDIKGTNDKGRDEKRRNDKRRSVQSSKGTSLTNGKIVESGKNSKFASFKKSLGMKTSEEKAKIKLDKAINSGLVLRDAILQEENGRWPDEQWRAIVQMYQNKTGMASKIADLRLRFPIQYLHLLRAGYFEPIPVAWANLASNPLKFSIEASEGWRGITPAWRGYEDTAEERLYWVLNHREGSVGTRLKPDFISALDMARQRMASAVPPPPEYFDPNDTCHPDKGGYSMQVMPAPFKAFDRPETSSDDTMILLDVSGSMDFVPQRPRYDRYLITGFDKSTQPKNKDLARAVIRRFVDAMINHDRAFEGYDLTTFANSAHYVGTVNHHNMDSMWNRIQFGGGTRVMTGWQKVKELHFQKHSHSAIHHPVYGWQAGPDTPMLRLLLLLDGEATDMDEFELDLLGLDWAHITIFLIGVDGCPHHHRHANELQRISDVNHHVSFVDAQGNTPERFVTHELLKRHLGYDLSISEFREIEVPPTYQEATRS